MTLEQVMRQKNFVVAGNTLEAGKPAREIKEKLLEHGYSVHCVGKELASLNDVPGDVDVLDLCIHPAKGLKLLQECRRPFGFVVIQPGAESDELCAWLQANGHPYRHGCLLVAMRLYAGDRAVWD